MPAPDTAATGETAFLRAIDDRVDRHLDDRFAEFAALGPEVADFARAARDFVIGGKRLRASFVRAGWSIAGGADDGAPTLDAAVAVELLQGSALVHDDLMDGSDTRRGRPSVHRDFEARHRAAEGVGDPVWFGTAAAVLMGDLLLAWSGEVMVEASRGVTPQSARTALGLYDRCKDEVTAGQFLDVVMQTRPAVSVDDALLVATYKSAKYTVERPLQIGAALAGADQHLLDGLSAVAVPLGVAFQLRDDVLGVTGDPAVTGKPAGDDLREGKRTVLVGRALERLDREGRDRLMATLGTTDVAAALDLIRASGALEAVEADIARLEAEADAAIESLEPSAAVVLRPLAARATRRDR